MNRLKLLYPFFFACLPVLNIFTRSPGGSSPSDSAVVLGVALLGCAAVYGVVGLALRGRWSNPVVPLVVLAAVPWFYWYDGLVVWSRRLAGGGAAPFVILVAVGATIAIVWWLSHRPRYLNQVATFFTLTGLLLVGWSGVRVVADQVRASSALRHSLLARELAQPIVVKQASAAAPASQRDIYLILLDEYANSAVLSERFGFDNRIFEDSLRRLGFTIPRSVRSNYVHTLLSLPSLLNFSHLTQLETELGPRATDPTVPNYLLEHNRTVAFLKARGYKFVFFPSQWWSSTEHNRDADYEFRAWTGFELGRDATRSDLRRSLVRSTALDLLRTDHRHDADHVKRTLTGLERIPELAEPTFAFAHIINPHRPYVFDADCRTARSGAGGRGDEGRKRGYVDQLECLNRLLLELVTTLVQRSSVPPVILLQGDHGTSTLEYSRAPSASKVSPAQARERFGAFGAYYLPGGAGALFADSVTLVNVFRKVLDHYFDAGIPLAPDDLYMSLERTPYSFVRVDPASLTPPPAADAQSRVRIGRAGVSGK